MDRADTVRVEVAIQHRTRAWQTIEVDLGPTSADSLDLVEPAIPGLHEMGVPATSPVRCISLSEQVAQKLHASTAPGTSATRARDVLDILLIETLAQFDYPSALAAARRVFTERSTHDFPPNFSVPAAWRQEWEAMAAQLSFPVADAAGIEQMFRQTISRIAAGR
jgi:hypothetical protein